MKNHDCLQLRQILRLPSALVYTHFRPDVSLKKTGLRVANLLKMTRFKDKTSQREIKNYMVAARFHDQMEANIDKIIHDCDLILIAHPSGDIVANVTNLEEFKQLLQRCDIAEEFEPDCIETASTYFELLKMRDESTQLGIKGCSE